MKTKTFLVILLCLMLVSVSGAMLVNAKRGSFTAHVFKDLNENNVQDPDEPSVSKVLVSFFSPFRVKLTNSDGDATFRFLPYPAGYYMVVRYFQSHESWLGVGGILLCEESLGWTTDVPLHRLK